MHQRARAGLGYLPQDFGLYPALTVRETLDYMGLLYNLGDAADRARRIEAATLLSTSFAMA